MMPLKICHEEMMHAKSIEVQSWYAVEVQKVVYQFTYRYRVCHLIVVHLTKSDRYIFTGGSGSLMVTQNLYRSSYLSTESLSAGLLVVLSPYDNLKGLFLPDTYLRESI
ncbi:hypothetical protein TNCV_3341631 [Trichonephila clavipes]|nr:hypothetical protein TNCV_3341631 [Trichonephila clavipes]